ncbi:unnamed protein product [Mycena citricolor]|uniref:Uncharacterized protein n=1 Tax=Mycena citricolor TaxID=2018698 RepID=A0AAD2GVU5_9AGAR|nr:unnamed protein product [Mycena citricolor]
MLAGNGTAALFSGGDKRESQRNLQVENHTTHDFLASWRKPYYPMTSIQLSRLSSPE